MSAPEKRMAWALVVGAIVTGFMAGDTNSWWFNLQGGQQCESICGVRGTQRITQAEPWRSVTAHKTPLHLPHLPRTC